MKDLESHSNDKLLSVRQVSELCAISERKIWRDVAANLFPQPVKLGPKTTRWWQSEIGCLTRIDSASRNSSENAPPAVGLDAAACCAALPH